MVDYIHYQNLTERFLGFVFAVTQIRGVNWVLSKLGVISFLLQFEEGKKCVKNIDIFIRGVHSNIN